MWIMQGRLNIVFDFDGGFLCQKRSGFGSMGSHLKVFDSGNKTTDSIDYRR